MSDNRWTIVAVQECANGNGEVGEMWLETATFDADAPISDIFDWRSELHKPTGRLMLTKAANRSSNENGR